MSKLRFKSVEEAFSHKPVKVNIPDERPDRYYGCYVFNRQKMFEYLPKKILRNFSKSKLTIKRQLAVKLAR